MSTSKHERNGFREITYNQFHRTLPPAYCLTDLDNVVYSHVGGNIVIHALIDLKSSKEPILKNGELVSSIRAQNKVASMAGVPFFIAVHDDAYAVWTVYKIVDGKKVTELESVNLTAYLEWYGKIRGRNFESDYNAMREDMRAELNRVTDNRTRISHVARQTWIVEAIENAFERLDQSHKMNVVSKLQTEPKLSIVPATDKQVMDWLTQQSIPRLMRFISHIADLVTKKHGDVKHGDVA